MTEHAEKAALVLRQHGRTRHLVCVQGCYHQGLSEGVADFSCKHSHYAGPLERGALLAALRQKDAELETILTAIEARGADEFAIDFFGKTRGFVRYSAIMLQHEALHHGQWSLYAALGGFASAALLMVVGSALGGFHDLYEVIADDTLTTVTDKMEKDELKVLVAERINQLPEVPRKVLAMYYYEDMRLAEIAAVLSLPLGVARVLIGDLVTQGYLRVHTTLGDSTTVDERRELIGRTLRGLRAL